MLAGLNDAQWGAATVAPQWSVKDIALHLIDVDLSWVARHRDRDRSGLVCGQPGPDKFVDQLARRNQQWVDGTRVLSERLIIDMLRWAGEQLDNSLAAVDLRQPSSVYWAGEAPLWFDLAREFTERWVHFQQIWEACQPTPLGRDGSQHEEEYLPLVVRTFVWGFPHQYQAPAQAGTTVGLEIGDVGAWTLTRSATGWVLDEGGPTDPAASLWMTGNTAWRVLTGAPYDKRQVRLSGEPALSQPLLQVRGIIV